MDNLKRNNQLLVRFHDVSLTIEVYDAVAE